MDKTYRSQITNESDVQIIGLTGDGTCYRLLRLSDRRIITYPTVSFGYRFEETSA